MRARNIKPGFYKNEDLAECDPLSRILFTGLWCLADREGRMEYRPKRIKAEILPYDEIDINTLINELQSHGFIILYSVSNINYLAIPKFTQHQNCHVKEAPSTIPAPDEHGASTIQEPKEHGTSPSDSLLLNPESPTLNPEEELTSAEDVSSPRKCPHQEIIALYHEILPELPPVKLWTPQREAILRQRWTEDPERQCMEWWRDYFQKVRGSPFLMGQEKEFRADLEWIIRPKNMPKVIEGRYDKRNGNGKKHAGIKSWLEKSDEEARQGEVCEGDGSSGGDIRPGTGAV